VSRPVSQENLDFFPVPEPLVEHIIRLVKALLPHEQDVPGPITVLDLFAGEGYFAGRMAEHLNGRPYLVELDKKRAASAAAVGPQGQPALVINAPAETMTAAGGWSVVIFNPPYDNDPQSGGRLEVYLWHKTIALMAQPGTIFAIVLPSKVARLPKMAREFYRYLDRCAVIEFPAPYDNFKQLLIMGVARPAPLDLLDIPQWFPLIRELDYPRKGWHNMPTFTVNNYLPVTAFESVQPNWKEVLAEANTKGIRSGPLWAEFLRPRTGAGAFQPLIELDAGKAALLTAAGMANSTVIDHWVLKGATRVYIVKSEDTKEGTDGEMYPVVIERETYAQVLTLFDLLTGDVEVLDSKDSHDKYTQFILAHADALIQNIRDKYPPLWNERLVTDRWKEILDRMLSPRILPGIPPGLLPKQRQLAAAIAYRLQTCSVGFAIGEQGTGKTATTIAAILLANASKILRLLRGDLTVKIKIVAIMPGHLVRKFAREAIAVGKNFNVKAVIIGEERPGRGNKPDRFPLLDVRAAMNEPGITFLVLSKETAKNGSPWAPRSGERHRRRRVGNEYEVHQITDTERVVVTKNGRKYQDTRYLSCPACGAPIVDKDGEPIWELSEKKRWKCTGSVKVYNGKTKQTTERPCGATLYTHGEAAGSYDAFATYAEAFRTHDWGAVPPRTPEVGKRQLAVGFRRAAVAEYISQHYGGRYDVIADEVHQYKSHTTDQGYAANDLVVNARHVIFATGTPYGGLASTIFDLLFKAIPWFKNLYAYDEGDKFVKHFGLIQTTYTGKTAVESHDSTMGYNRGRGKWGVSVKEIPGAHPVMASFMLPYAGFMRLSEMGVNLPKYTEERLPVNFLKVGTPRPPRPPQAAVPQPTPEETDNRVIEGFFKNLGPIMDLVPSAGIPELIEQINAADDTREVVDMPIKLTPDLEKQVVEALGQLYHQACNPKAQGWSAFMHAGNGWPDNPVAEIFTFKDGTTGSLPALKLPAGMLEWPKVQTVCDMVVSERAIGRKSIIYVDQVHRRNCIPQYVEALRTRGMKTYVLSSATEPDEREELIAAAVASGIDVLITNGSLVETGLDLTFAATIFRVQPITSFYKENQQDRRHWRLGQLLPCRVIWVYYDFSGSVQALTVALMAKKLRAALLMNGDLAEGLAATEDSNDSFLQELMKQLRDGQAAQWDDVPVATPAPASWTPAWTFTFADWLKHVHTIAAHAKGRVYVRPGAKPVLWPRSATDEQIIAWEYRDEALKARSAGVVLPAHAQSALLELPLLPGEKSPAAPAAPAYRQDTISSVRTETVAPPVPPGEIPVLPAGFSEPIQPKPKLSLRSLGNGTLMLRNGGPEVRIIWLGGDRLSGPAKEIAQVRQYFAEALKQKPTKKWEMHT